MRARVYLYFMFPLLLASCDKSTIDQLVQDLPMCQQGETLKTVGEIVNELPVAKAEKVTFVALKEIREQGFNKEAEVRACAAILVTTVGEDKVQYSIKWQDKASKQYYVDLRVI